jgi:hypothetical protein
MLTDNQMQQLTGYLTGCAREIAADDPELLRSFDGFCAVMWSDDSELELWAASRDEFRDALRGAYDAMKR